MRTEVAQVLQISKAMVRRLEFTGVLNPMCIEGVHFFDREQVNEAARSRQGFSAAAFRLFESGKQPVDVVIELDAEPEHIHRLWDSYHRMQNCWVVEGPTSMKAWEPVYKLGPLTPHKLLKALELVCSNPKLHAELRAMDRPAAR